MLGMGLVPGGGLVPGVGLVPSGGLDVQCSKTYLILNEVKLVELQIKILLCIDYSESAIRSYLGC